MSLSNIIRRLQDDFRTITGGALHRSYRGDQNAVWRNHMMGGVPWAVFRDHLEEGTLNIRGRCVAHITGRGVLKQGWKWSEQLSAERQTMRRHVLVVTVIYSHIIIASFIWGQYQIQNMDFKYHTAINNGRYKYINRHCPLYIMAVSAVIECGSFTFKTQVVTEMRSASPHVKLETIVKVRKTSAWVNLECITSWGHRECMG